MKVVEEMVVLYESGMSLEAVGASVGLSRGTVKARLIAAGVPIRGKVNRGERNGRWSTNPTANAGRLRAHKQFPDPEPCGHCGSEDQPTRHHKDGDPTNNVADNIAWLCSPCHVRHHREQERLTATGVYGALQYVDAWCEQYRNGATVSEIAAGSPYAWTTVWKWLRARGVFEPFRDGTRPRREAA